MSRDTALKGGCSCGRNQYTIVIPRDSTETAQVFFDNGHHHRRSQATPISAFLRIPLTWYQSTTTSYLSDETHATIRRTYTSPQQPSSKRHFCGFCGTPLSYWTESPPAEAEYISLTLGSLEADDLRSLEEWGVLPGVEDEDVKDENESTLVGVGDGVPDGRGEEGLPWFQSLVEGSRLGDMRRSMGNGRSRDGRFTVEWEIVEWKDGDEERGEVLQPSAKRKLRDVIEEDSKMEGSR